MSPEFSSGYDEGRAAMSDSRRIQAVLSRAFIVASSLGGALITSGCGEKNRGDEDNGCGEGTPQADCDMSVGGSNNGSPNPLGYCDVEPLIHQYCGRCHSNPPQNFAGFSLVTWEDLQAPYSTVSDELIWEKMAAPIERDFMPLTALDLDPPVEPLPDPAKEILLEWLEAGAPFGEHCAD